MRDDAHEGSTFVRHEPCPNPKCGSSDAFGLYTDGHGFCFACRHYEPALDAPKRTMTNSKKSTKAVDFLQGEYRPLPIRKLTEETCKFWGYTVGENKDGKTVQIANYRGPDGGEIVAQKLRFANKDFTVIGSIKDAGLYGQWLWRDSGRKVVVTEGEIDAMSVSQIQHHKWPVVSVPNGAQGAKKAVQRALEWLEGFEEVVFMFDDDAPGREAAKECAAVLTPGKAKIATIRGFKDANEALQAGKGELVVEAMWGAKSFRPDGIVAGDETLALALQPVPAEDASLPWPKLNSFIRGLRRRELVTLTAGTGIGKSTVAREIAAHLLSEKQRVGYVALEESVQRTVVGFCSIALDRPLHLDRTGLTDDEITKAWKRVCGGGNLFLYDHFGSVEGDNLMAKMRYLAHGCGCHWLFLDHVSIVVSGLEIVDERKAIDVLMTQLRSLVEETGVGLVVISHLKRVEGSKGHEDGVQVSLSHLRGSQAIAQLSDRVIALERDQQKDDSTLLVRMLKDRRIGKTGVAGHLRYVEETARLIESDPPFSDEEGGKPNGDF